MFCDMRAALPSQGWRLRIAMALGLAALFSPSAATAVDTIEIEVPGLDGPAWVVRDADGIAHVYARSERDMAFAQGWLQARDRLFQLDVTRRNSNGSLAELLGPDALPSDIQLRTLGILRGAQASEAALSPVMRESLEAFAAGVNAWVAAHPLPPEYAALEISRFAPWTVLDSLVVGKALGFSLSFGLDTERTEQLLTLQGTGQALCAAQSPACFDGTALFFEDLFRAAPFESATTIPDANGDPVRPGRGARRPGQRHMPAKAREKLRRWVRSIRKNAFLAPALEREHADVGSNEWAIAGRLTKSGRPIMANDPHLALNNPATFYPSGIHAGPFDAVGIIVPGNPYITLGQNRDITWGTTTNALDVTDVFQERVVADPNSPSGLSIQHSSPNAALDRIIPVPEVFRANTLGDGIIDNVVTVPPSATVPAATLIVPRRNNGPIIALDFDPTTGQGTAFSVAYVGYAGTRELESFRQINLAKNLTEFRAALDYFDVGSQNFAYADRRGNIAYFTSGEAPLREDLEAGTIAGASPAFIRNGTGGNDWILQPQRPASQALPYAVLPMEEMPQVVNPRRGFFVNANNDPLGLTLDNNGFNTLRPSGGIYYLAPGYADGLRAYRITTRLEEALRHGKVDMDDMQSVQADVGLGDAEFFVPFIRRAWRQARAGGAPPALAALAEDGRLRQAVRRFRRWDFTAPTGIEAGYDESDIAGHRFKPTRKEISNSVAATIYSVWRGQFVRRVIDGTVSNLAAAAGLSSLPRPGSAQSMSALRFLLENFNTRGGVGVSGVDFFAVPSLSNPDDRLAYTILICLADALDRLAGDAFAPAFDRSTNQRDYRWGRLHRLVLDSPLGGPFNLPSAAAGFPPPLNDLPGYPTDGGYSVVDASSHSARAQDFDDFMYGSGANRRYVGQAGRRRIRAISALPGGPSGVLGSPWYGSLLNRWLTNDGYPVRARQRQVFTGQTESIRLVPRR